MMFPFAPAGIEAALLCVATCTVLAALLVAGFILVSASLRAPRSLDETPIRRVRQLGVVGLWRLDRQLRASRHQARIQKSPDTDSSAA